ncbi:MAG: family 10 glycosylhydrolase [Chitinophagaceae bacterium]|nr:family 10 glycosylhydrolase [Chitinophagaceae bacterium]
MRYITFLLVSLLVFTATQAQHSPKREFRAAWIATVSNIDWPSKQGLPSVQQKQELINRLDALRAIGCNAVILQIRPAADALYASEIEPWSRFLSGKQGQQPFPAYDPLSFAIEEAHKRNMELHAWFNPFRALTDSKKNPNPPNHITHTRPDWIISYGGKSYIDPGVPEAREYVTKVIMDVVKRYDIDGVHIDDYFYPYRIAGLEFGDARSYARFKESFSDKEDWRRNNVSSFVATLYNNIKSEKKFVKFGISPFGVWRNASKDPEGSPTRGGQTCYDDLYSDILLWQRKGWLDYSLPQLYWEHGHRAVAFETLLPWWENHSYKRHMYIGLGVYRMAEFKAVVWQGAGEILKQIEAIRSKCVHPGVVFYSASSFNKISSALSDSLKQNTNKHFAFPPQMPWLDNKAPEAPELSATASKEGLQLSWTTVGNRTDNITYAVYRFDKDQNIDLDDSKHIIAVQKGNKYLAKNTAANDAVYVVTALDRLWNESKASNTVEQ